MTLLYFIPGLMRFFRRAEAATRGRGLLAAEGSIPELRRAVSFVRAIVINYYVSIVILLPLTQNIYCLLVVSYHIYL